MIYLFQFSCFFLFSIILFLVFLALWLDRVLAFYSSFFVGLVVFFASLRDVNHQIGFTRYFGLKLISKSDVFSPDSISVAFYDSVGSSLTDSGFAPVANNKIQTFSLGVDLPRRSINLPDHNEGHCYENEY